MLDMLAVWHALEPRPTKVEDEDDDEHEHGSAKRYPSFSTICSMRSVTLRIWLGVRNDRWSSSSSNKP